ncbi:PREDICTED: outer dense fiber protein 4 [Hipposideros armiger]|uniref:Outer dense fiber protein 4 n=1 Tax=Hipposideros armiger TaxID=186990 RepID=A0A8B7T6W2_HIPAR|nr:PREDICTED: outer dense fiber protein 4 [Hipposideros armiger]
MFPVMYHRGSLLPLLWRNTYSSHWKAQVLVSGLSLISFILLLVMVFSKKWLYLSKIHFHQRWPMNVSNRIYMSAHVMSMGLLQICKVKSCSNSENGKVTFIFFTLMLFPVNIWIFELKRNLSIPIGWSYSIGWVVFVLYVTCAFLCYFKQKFLESDLSHPSDTMSCSSSSRSDSLNEEIVSNTSINQEEVLDLEQEKATL